MIRRPSLGPAGGFTLIEITISIFVLALGLTSILAVFPVAIESAKFSIDRNLSCIIAQNAIARIDIDRPGRTTTGRLVGVANDAATNMPAIEDHACEFDSAYGCRITWKKIMGAPSGDASIVKTLAGHQWGVADIQPMNYHNPQLAFRFRTNVYTHMWCATIEVYRDRNEDGNYDCPGDTDGDGFTDDAVITSFTAWIGEYDWDDWYAPRIELEPAQNFAIPDTGPNPNPPGGNWAFMKTADPRDPRVTAH